MDAKNFERLLSSTKEAKEIITGKKEPSRKFFIEEPNPKDIRAKLSLTQEKFAALMNISVHTLRNWEQGRRHPEGPARVLLNVVNNHPEVLEDILQKS
ncbi:MAG: helix-turn-helix domain-containing protein [Campylobacterales bacterium]